MSDVRHRIWAGLWLAVLSVVLLLAVIPQRYIPGRLSPSVTAKGRFAGIPIQLAMPKGGKPEVAATVLIQMDQGTCRVILKHGTELTGLFRTGEGYWRGQIPTGSELVLDPQGNAGDYDITLGPKWHLLAPRARRFFFLPMAIGMTVMSIFGRRLRPQVSRLGAKRIFFIAATCVISGLVLYPAVHEGGHVVFGMLFGARPRWDGVVWTCLGGQEPYAAFSYLPEGAVPFMSAGGPIVPTLVALLLLVIWRFSNKNASWYVSATLVSIAILFLFSALGCLFELYRNTHMDALSVHFGLTGPLRIAFSLSPLFVAVAACVWLGMKIRESMLGQDQPETRSMKTLDG
jgi:hypothetical protein